MKRQLPSKGETIIIHGPAGESAHLRKCSNGRDWTLHDPSRPNHSRFGNADEIRQDCDHFELCGSLPVNSYSF